MTKPITWRTIAGPSFNNSAGGQAIDAFRSAGAGFSDLTDSLFKTQDRVDEQFTNQALQQALQSGQVDPNMNQRADSAQVWEALLGKRRADTDEDVARSGLKSDVVSRNLSRADIAVKKEQAADYTYKNSEPYRKLMERATEAEISADEASTAYNSWRQSAEKDETERGKLIRNQRQDLENKLIEIRQGAYKDYLSQNVPPGTAPTPEQEQQARMYAESASQDPAARQMLEQYRYENKYLDEAWDLSTWGERDALNDATMASLAEKRAERNEKQIEAGFEEGIARGQGDLSKSMLRNGQLVPLTDEFKEVEKMSSYTEALSKMQDNGINVNRLLFDTKSDSKEKKVIELARTKLPNASLLSAAIEPYIGSDGKLDVEGFNKVLGDVGNLTRMDIINRSRVEKGLPPVKTDSTTDSNASAVDILGSAPPAVQSAFAGIAWNLIPSNIRPDAEKMLSEESSARLSIASDLAQSAVSSPIDKANLFVTLLRAYLNKEDKGETDSTKQ